MGTDNFQDTLNRRKFIKGITTVSTLGIISTNTSSPSFIASSLAQQPSPKSTAIQQPEFDDVDPDDFTGIHEEVYNELNTAEQGLDSLFEVFERAYIDLYTLIGEYTADLGNPNMKPTKIMKLAKKAPDKLPTDNSKETNYLRTYAEGIVNGLYTVGASSKALMYLVQTKIAYQQWEKALEQYKFQAAQKLYETYDKKADKADKWAIYTDIWWDPFFMNHLAPFEYFEERRVERFTTDVLNVKKLYTIFTQKFPMKDPNAPSKNIFVDIKEVITEATKYMYEAEKCIFGDEYTDPETTGLEEYNCLEDTEHTQEEINNMSAKEKQREKIKHGVALLGDASYYYKLSRLSMTPPEERNITNTQSQKANKLPEKASYKQDIKDLEYIFSTYEKTTKALQKPIMADITNEEEAKISRQTNEAIKQLNSIDHTFLKTVFQPYIDEYTQRDLPDNEDQYPITRTQEVDAEKSDEFLTKDDISDGFYGMNIVLKTVNEKAVQNVRVTFIDEKFNSETVVMTDEYGVASRIFPGPRHKQSGGPESPDDPGEGSGVNDADAPAEIEVVVGDRTDAFRTDEFDTVIDPDENGKSNKGISTIEKGTVTTYYCEEIETTPP